MSAVVEKEAIVGKKKDSSPSTPTFPPLLPPRHFPSVGAGMETNLQIVLCLGAHLLFIYF